MALRLCTPVTVPLPLPELKVLKVGCDAAGAPGEGVQPSFQQGELINVVGRTPGGDHVYAVSGADARRGGAQGRKEGWLPGPALRTMTPSEVAALPEGASLSIQERLHWMTLVEVKEAWQEIQEPSTLALRIGDVLQLETVREGWGFGSPMENQSRRGWFPLAFVRPVESSIASLAKAGGIELPPTASGAVVELLKSVPEPPPLPQVWTGELPAAVAESAQQFEREWAENLRQIEAHAASQEATGDLTPGADADKAKELKTETLPEDLQDLYPLVVCKIEFKPPKRTAGALLPLRLGDLVRVTSPLTDLTMYYGFIEGKPNNKGWFPRRYVQLVEDPLQVQEEIEIHFGPPPLPTVPPNLRREAVD